MENITAANETVEKPKTDISFDRQFNGYDREQVDRYIAGLDKAYRTAYDEYTAACAKHNELLERYRQLECKNSDKPDTDVISKAIINTEIMAQRVRAEAEAEAAVIKAEAEAEAKRIKNDAYVEAASVKIQSQKLLDEAAVNAAATRDKAEVIMAEINTEADRARRRNDDYRAQTDVSIRDLIARLQGLLTLSAADAAARLEFPTLISADIAKAGA